jgi:hypothetical protein
MALRVMVLMVIGDAGDPTVFGAKGHGGTERMIVYPAMLWMLAYGGYILARPRSDARWPQDEPGWVGAPRSASQLARAALG